MSKKDKLTNWYIGAHVDFGITNHHLKTFLEKLDEVIQEAVDEAIDDEQEEVIPERDKNLCDCGGRMAMINSKTFTDTGLSMDSVVQQFKCDNCDKIENRFGLFSHFHLFQLPKDPYAGMYREPIK